MEPEVKIFPDATAVAKAFADDFANWVNQSSKSTLTVALSGGTTPKLLFSIWAEQFADKLDWSRLHFFWGDERCVPPTDGESNFKAAKTLFLDKVSVPASNIHRVIGEADPGGERLRYENEICTVVEVDDNGMPRFDKFILGLGDDGHTASIFPHESEFLMSDRICEVATHPTSGQKRITLTGPVINMARSVDFLVTGAGKAIVLPQVVYHKGDYESFPASHIRATIVTFYVDEAAAKNL